MCGYNTPKDASNYRFSLCGAQMKRAVFIFIIGVQILIMTFRVYILIFYYFQFLIIIQKISVKNGKVRIFKKSNETI